MEVSATQPNLDPQLAQREVPHCPDATAAADANCLPSILDLGDEPFILAQDEDRLLTQNNINLYQE
jgi:hypothetical protein